MITPGIAVPTTAILSETRTEPGHRHAKNTSHLDLHQVKEALDTLPSDRAPTQHDWARLARPWRQQVADRLLELQALQNTLDGCLGCGCLSLTRCALFNADDEAAAESEGSRWLREATRPRERDG